MMDWILQDLFAESRFVGAFWGALFGAIGGAIGALLAAIFKSRLRGVFVSVGAVLGFVAPLIVDQIAGEFAQRATHAEMERRSFDRSPEVQAVLGSLREADPQTYSALRRQWLDLAADPSISEMELMNALRGQIGSLVIQRLAIADSADVRDYVELLVDQFDAYGASNPSLCVRALRGEALDDVRPYLSEDLQQRELDLTRRVLSTPMTTLPEPNAAVCAPRIDALIADVYTQVGDDISLLDPNALHAGQEARVCQLGSVFFAEVLTRSDAEVPVLMQCLMAQ